MNKSNKEQITINQLKELGTYHKFKTIYGDPPWSRLQKHAYKKRYKTMSLDVWRKAVIVATESDVKEGGYSLPNEQVE